MTNLVFVYGSLLSGEDNNYLLAEAQLISESAWVFGKLYDTKLGYPGMVESEQYKVHGQIWLVDAIQLAQLDALEGYSESLAAADNEYIRVKKDVYTEQGILQAWVYIYNQTLNADMCLIASGRWQERERQNQENELNVDPATDKTCPDEKEYYAKEYQELYYRRNLIVRVLAVTLLAFATVMVFGPWARVLHFPSLDLISDSRQLQQEAEIREWMKPVVLINTLNSKATGFNIDPDGIIVTNYHVVENNSSIFVTFESGAMYRASVVAEFPDIDLALLDIDGKNLPVTQLTSVKNINMDERMIVIGNPLGLVQIVKQGKALGFMNVRGMEKPMLVVEMSILQGSSGSPVFNHNGDVVGVIFANTDTEDSELDVHLGLAVPIDYLLDKMEAIPQ